MSTYSVTISLGIVHGDGDFSSHTDAYFTFVYKLIQHGAGVGGVGGGGGVGVGVGGGIGGYGCDRGNIYGVLCGAEDGGGGCCCSRGNNYVNYDIISLNWRLCYAPQRAVSITYYYPEDCDPEHGEVHPPAHCTRHLSS